jgi:hypothetical protein
MTYAIIGTGDKKKQIEFFMTNHKSLFFLCKSQAAKNGNFRHGGQSFPNLPE